MKNSKKVIWITRTGLFLAIALLAQIIGAYIQAAPLNQIFTGVLVNMALIISAVLVGRSSGVIIGIMTPVVALMLGIMAIPPAAPVIIAGNVVIVLLASTGFKIAYNNKSVKKYIIIVLTIIISSVVKFAVLYGSVKLVLPLVISNEKQIAKLGVALGVMQLFTAVGGGILSAAILPALRRARTADEQHNH